MKLPPSIRLSIGLVMLTLSVILFADLFGLVPNQDHIELDSRKKVCESLAVQLSVYATNLDTPAMNQLLESFVDRNDDILAASMRKTDGELLAIIGKFSDNALRESKQESTAELVVVPVYAGEDHWGSVNVEFKGKYGTGLYGLTHNTRIVALIFITISCFAGYYFILRRALRILDPKSVVPDRVRSAFNALSEGVIIVDKKNQIIMANKAFAEKVDKDSDALMGMDASALNWSRRKEEMSEDMPWQHSIKHGKKQTGISLHLITPNDGIRNLSINSAPIVDDDGKARGALVTFDDITKVQETNEKLENAVDDLTRKQSEIARKNIELETLASRDSLTGCYNRRAFFDKFEMYFEYAVKNGEELSCIMLDIDHFKSVNDRFGHGVGDEVIAMVAGILNSYQRSNTLIGRYGGEEFCIVLNKTGLDSAMAVAERLRINIEGSGAHNGQLKVTASFGVAGLNDGLERSAELVDRADIALYAAKEAGRNRVMQWKSGLSAARKHRNTTAIEHVSETDELKYTRKVQMEILENKIASLEAELKKRVDSVVSSSYTDSVTGLPTRIILEDRLQQALALAQRTNTIAVVAVLNIDMLSRITDAHGDEVGDAFLKEVANRLKAITRRSDTVASMVAPGHSGPSLSRLRGDEFALVFSGINEVESISNIVRRIQEKFKGKIQVDGREFYVSMSVGMSLFPADGEKASVLVEHARTAQKFAKQTNNKNSTAFYSSDINAKVIQQMELEADVHTALEQNQFTLVYQPKLDMKLGETHTVETLIRWEHPERGMLLPYVFISLAERSGMIIELGQWILRSACVQTKKWVDMGAKDIRTSVNVSAIEFTDDDFVLNVRSVLRDTGLSARHLEIEITESVVLKNFEDVAKKIEELRLMGVTMTLDDFGTGYSSFSYLGKLDFDWIKLDRVFLLEALSNDRSRMMYKGIVEMAHNAGFRVVSEGIEDKLQYEFVHELKVDELQGYILSRPVVAEEISNILFKHGQVKKIAS